MKLTNLDLSQFRSYTDVSFDLNAPRVLIAGLNGSGKTSIREAIKWALTGACDVTDPRGAGAEALIPDGSDRAVLGLSVDAIGRIDRGFGPAGGGLLVQGMTGSSQIQQQALYAKLNTTPEYLKAVLDSTVFLDLTHADAKALVLSLLDVKIQANSRSYSLDELNIAYKDAFEARKVAKKVLAVTTLSPKPADQPKMPAVEKIEVQLATLRTQIGDARQATGSVTGKREALTAERSSLNALVADGMLADRSAELEALYAEAEATQPETAPQPGDPKRLAFLRSRVEALQRHEPSKGCVIDGSLPCKTPKAAFGDLLSAFNAELKAMDPRPVESTLTGKAASVAAKIGELSAHQGKLQQQMDALSRIEAIDQALDALPNTDAQQQAVTALQERIGKGEQLLRESRTYWAALAAYEASKGEQAKRQADVDRLEEQVAVLGPNGARVPALAEALGRFESAVNPYVQPFGWTVRFTVEPWGVIVNNRPVETYSRSEQYRIGVAVQLGIAMLSGLKFAVVDEIDMLDVANRSALTKMLLTAPLDQILILGTREPSQALPKAAGVKVYRIAKDGAQTRIAETA